MKLLLPIKDISVTQPFGVNYLDFYKKMGMKGHNGIDFKTKRGCIINAAHSGTVSWAGEDSGGGISVILNTKNFKTIYYHLLKIKVRQGNIVKQGQIIGLADNTGKYTTGDHLHFGLKLIDKNGITINKDNGYKGAINPAPYFKKNWNKSNAYHRYGRKRVWLAEFNMRFKNAWLHRKLIKIGLNPILNGEQINTLVYGGWDFDTIINPSMYMSHWGWLKKSEFLKGKRAFL